MSLLESCLAVGIISVVTMAAVPSLMRTRETYELDAASRQVASHMQSARIKAVRGNRDCRLRVATQASYMVECKDTSWQIEDTIVLPRGLTIRANATPQFHKLGSVSPAATITLRDSHGHSKQVIVNITGRVRVS